MDFGLWYMHWLSHKKQFLWKLHALHHSPERLYWLNGERRHPLSALLMAGPGILCVTLMGAPANVIGASMGLTAIHLAFQHANLDNSLGIFKHLFGVAEIHGWYHKHGFGRKNLSEFLMIWDHLFGTYHYEPQPVNTGQVGLRTTMPKTYLKQLFGHFQAKN
ncbi:sterol desaturase family protein [Acinetobacter sp. A3.8]|uniref:Sterol desaturase family protein n=2 Tax=Acinetobacter sedimenti TaxID=2919922 RepID=A0A9X2B6A9_9GAMM|nr:sterol desaturase family protein [Acinetobacter sedimenti]